MTRRSNLLLVVLVLVSTVATVGLGTVTAQETESSTSCSTTVVHDAFRFDNSTVAQAANGTATASKSNTKVTVEQTTGFIRVKATNPNGYCVKFHVQIDEEVIAPAELGEIDAISSNTTASWHATRDFEREETFTEVVFTLGPAESVTFAPSEARVKSLSWTGTVESKGASFWQNLTDIEFFKDDSDLEKRSYTFSPENNSTSIVTISLKNASDGRTIKEWQALYRPREGDWKPISKESEKPVFYRKVDEHRIQFIFNDPDAEVKWTANPNWRDKADYQVKSYLSGLGDLKDIINLSDILWLSPGLGGYQS